jgi:hypothetical protein
MLAYHPKRSATSFTLLRTIWNCRLQVYTAYPANVGWSTETSGKENLQNIWLGQHKSAVAEHTFNDQHHIHLQETKTLFNEIWELDNQGGD